MPAYEAMRWLEYAWTRKHGRRATALELADSLCSHAGFLDHGWRRSDLQARQEGPSPDLVTAEMRLAEARLGRLTLGDLIPEAQIAAEAQWELEQAVVLVKPRTARERQAADDLAWIHAVGARRQGRNLETSRRRAISQFGRQFKRAPTEPSRWQLQEAERIIARRRKRERKKAETFRKALGGLPQMPPAQRAETVRRWRRRNPLSPIDEPDLQRPLSPADDSRTPMWDYWIRREQEIGYKAAQQERISMLPMNLDAPH